MLAIFAALAFMSSGCNPEPEPDPTRAELLTQPNGWQLTAGTSDPAYQLELGVPITNLFDGFVAECELDDILYFNQNGSEILSFGKDEKTYPCEEEQTIKEKSLGNWALTEEDTKLKFYFPAYEEQVTATIISLNETTLKLSLAISEDDGVEASPLYRGIRGSKTIRDYVFTLTYTYNK